MTKKACYEDSYKSEFNATITRVEGNEVVLDVSYFFPQGGGQAGDTGYIGDERVINTQEMNGEVVHVLEKPSDLKEGERVVCRVDWGRRYELMRLHSAAHLLFYAVKEVIGDLRLIGSAVNPGKARLDYAFDGNIKEKLAEVQALVNKWVSEGKPIKTYFVDENTGERVWEWSDKKMPCGGVHVKNTKEIGGVVLKRVNLGKGKERIELKLA